MEDSTRFMFSNQTAVIASIGETLNDLIRLLNEEHPEWRDRLREMHYRLKKAGASATKALDEWCKDEQQRHTRRN